MAIRRATDVAVLMAAAAAAAAMISTGGPASVAAAPSPPPWPAGTGPYPPSGSGVRAGPAYGPDGEPSIAGAGRYGRVSCHRIRPGDEEVCAGRPGPVIRIRHAAQRRVVKRLPGDGRRAPGPSDVTRDAQGRIYFTTGLSGGPDLRGQITELSASRTAEAAPPQPDGVVSVGDGQLVAVAGADSLMRVNRRGRISTVATFPRQGVTLARGVPGGPAAGTEVAVRSVPTAVAPGPDGALYVGELTGYPFPPGKARVWRVVPGAKPAVYATGFTAIVDLAWGPGGRLYVLEIAANGLLSGDRTGALVRVDRHGARRVVASAALTTPGGLTIRGRTAYVSDCTLCKEPGPVLAIALR
jgi:hypothetical protein